MPRKSSNLLKRRLKIAEIVAAQGEIKVDDLSAQLGVSGVTIRGDLSYLEQQGYLKRSFGGAIATPLSSEPEAIQPIAPLSLAQQMEIARHCARLIRDRDTLFLGHGTICRKIIPLLSEVKKLRLITNDPEHALLANQFIDGEIILAGSEMLRPDTALAGKQLEQALQHFTITHSILEISHLLDRRPAALSGGQKQRVAIGSVIVRKPKAYLMDKPLSNLDAKLRAQMRVEIAKLHKQLNATIIYVTHDQVEAMTLGTRIVVMNQGMIQQVAPPAELYRNPVNKFVAGFIGSPTMNFLDVDVLEEDGTVWLLGQGWRLPLEGYQARKLKEKGFAGKRVTLGIRPEDLHQEECSRKNGSDGLNGNDSGWVGVYISVREMLGSEVLLHGNTGDTGRLSARMPASCRVKPGEFLRLYVDMPQIKLFDIQSEENILFD